MAITSSKAKAPEADIIELVIGNKDLLTEIFLYLPAKSLVRSKQVCKMWLSLISDPEFAIIHTRRNTINSQVCGFLYKNSFGLSSFLSLQSKFPCLDIFREKIGLVTPEHCCKGLILFNLIPNGQILFKNLVRKLVILNPTTQKYKLLAISQDILDIAPRGISRESFLLCDPAKTPDYKVVMLIQQYLGVPNLRVGIFSSRNGSWKSLSFTHTPLRDCTKKIVLKGVIHWLEGNKFHMQFDVDTEKLRRTPLGPESGILSIGNIQYFGESNGRLLIIQGYEDGAPEFQVLEMDINTHYLTIRNHINLRPLALRFPRMQTPQLHKPLWYSVLYVESGPDTESFSLILAIPHQIVLYEGKKGNCHTDAKSLSNLKLFCEDPHTDIAYPLIQCLAPV